MIEIRVPGLQLEGMAEAEESLADDITVEVKAVVRVASVGRGGQAVTIRAKEDDVVELQMDGGGVLWLRADELAARLGAPVRGSAGGAVELGADLQLEDATRGLGSWTIEVLRVLGIDVAGKSAEAIAAKLEKKAIDRPGLFRWNGRGGLEPFRKADWSAGDGPWLLFLHGTASSTRGSFGDLALAQAARWQELEKHYGKRILAFEHHTLTLSPIENALALVEELPTGIELHVVSHSRGGLVGELLSRGRITDAEGNPRAAFDEPELALFAEDGFATQRKELLSLGRALALQRPRLTRFVRVACPARGTSLMSERLDRWLNCFFNVTSLVTGGRLNPLASELLDMLRALVQATVKQRTEPDKLPGLAAMAPDHSPLLIMLNRQDARLQDELCVIAGDAEPTDLLRRLAIWFADVYFGQDHDLVVDTASMDGGTPRAKPPVVFREQAPHVNHFSYFANQRSAEVLARALTEAELPREIGVELTRAATETMPALETRATAEMPIVFVLPGISGTHLKVGGKRVWIDIGALAFGGVGRLAIDNSRVEPDELVARYYGDLCKLLSGGHAVRPWPYDWRRSIVETAGRLAGDLHAALDATERPVSIVAHSMGGLVARTAFALDPELWRRFKERRDCRLVMLGTPNGGSYAIPMLLLGRNRLMRYLAGLDLRASAADHLATVVRWPGALQLLPQADEGLFEVSGWKALEKLDPAARWAAESADALAEAMRFRKLLDGAPVDPDCMLYVAGQAKTYAGMVTSADGASPSITFPQTWEGDGQVLWSTGIPKGLRAWYARVAHGDLARDPAVMGAVIDLVGTGSTNQLPSAPPPAPRARGGLEPVAREPLGQLPSEDQFLATAMSAAPWTIPSTSLQRPVRITVVNGHLKFATHPVLVGHYIGDSLNGTELSLDREQNGRITRRRDRGLHPGPLGSYDAHIDPTQQPKGSVIVGLGDVGALSSGDLQATIRTGLVALASALDEYDDQCRKSDGNARGCYPRGVSCVLVGTGAGVLGITDSVVAIIRAVREANLILGDHRLDELELIELVEQRAINAWHAIKGRLEREELRHDFVLDETVKSAVGAWRRVGPDDDPTWWTPVMIQAAAAEGDSATVPQAQQGSDHGALRYVVIAGRARVEASLVATRRSVVDLYLQRMAQRRVETGPLSAARTAFELLWPNRLKEHSLEDRNIRLILDESAAALPWEMMDDRRPWVTERNAGTSTDRGPPAVRYGVLRQLVSARIRESVPSAALRRKALVIGDPRGAASGFDPLPGAEAEAQRVAALLQDRNFAVTALLGDRVMPEDVISALFADAWEIIHIAAHGVFKHRFRDDPTGEARTGIVLGGKPQPFVLDCEILEQLPIPPELFFVNCCSLGGIDPTDEQAFLRVDRPALASSIAVQLIRMGSRAVIAAGWEVEDEPAARFADKVYDGLLTGQGFGNVVKDARADVYHAYPRSSTWGAYQCYGNPDFRLARIDRTPRHADRPPPLAAPSEAISEIERIAAMADVGGDRDTRADLDALGRLQDAIAGKGWLDDAAISSALAAAFAAFGETESAIAYYERAARADMAALPVRAIEQLLNAQVKSAQRRPKSDKARAIKELETSIKRLQALLEACGPTLERFSLLGSAFKRLAYWQDDSAQRTRALEQMVEAYRSARLEGEAHAVDNLYYPWSQEVMGDVILALRDGKPSRKGIAKLRRSVGRPTVDDFWLRLLPMDLELLELLGRGTLSAKAQDTIVQGYVDVWEDTGSRHKLSSVLEQLDFYRRLLDDVTPRPKALIEGLGQIERRLGSAASG